MKRAHRIGPAPLAAAVRDRLLGRGGLILALDYDGTLAPIAPTAAAACLVPEGAEVLKRLAAVSHAVVAVVSGRTLSDLAGVLPPIMGLYRFGTHGVEGIGPDGAAIHAIRPAAPPSGLRVLAERVRVEPWPPGTFTEDKGLVVTLHYRLADEGSAARARDRFLTLARDAAAGTDTSVIHGRKVIEVRSVGVEKGAAVRWLRRWSGLRDPLLVYIGDDVTDEDGFAAVGVEGVSVLVAEQDRQTRADWRLGCPAEVLGFLDELDREPGNPDQ